MAKIELKGIDSYMARLQRLSKDVDKIIRQATYPAAGIVADAIRKNVPKDSGNLAESLALAKYTDKDGFVYTTIVFAGYDERGVPNMLKARVLEHGSSKRRAHPFIRPAVNRVKRQAEAMMAAEFTKLCEQKMKE